MLLRVVILRTNCVCNCVRWNALALDLMVQLKRLRRLLMMLVWRDFCLMCDNDSFLLLLFLLFDKGGEIVVAFTERRNVCWRYVLEFVHVNH